MPGRVKKKKIAPLNQTVHRDTRILLMSVFNLYVCNVIIIMIIIPIIMTIVSILIYIIIINITIIMIVNTILTKSLIL